MEEREREGGWEGKTMCGRREGRRERERGKGGGACLNEYPFCHI